MTDTTTQPPAAAEPTQVSGYTARTWEREPRAVVLVEPDDVRLGDVLVDAFGGQLLVEEIVRRSHEARFEFAAFKQRASFTDPLLTDRRRVVTRSGASLLRVARSIDRFGPLAGHHTRVRSHNPVQVGCYTHVDGWRAECSCSWPGQEPQIHGSQGHARAAWRTHKADVITRQGRDGHCGYFHVAAAEDEHLLPPVPWWFVKHNGIALASLDGLPLPEARQIAAAWAQAFGVEVDEHPTAHRDTVVLNVELPDLGDRGRTVGIATIRGYFPAEDQAEAT